jgi:hypothetical protein
MTPQIYYVSDKLEKYTEDEGCMLLRKIGNRLQDYRVPHTQMATSTLSLPWEPQISLLKCLFFMDPTKLFDTQSQIFQVNTS